MQESLFNTVKKLQTEQKINVEELEVILNSDIEEVVTLCKKACLKPKTDTMGNAYFTKNDVDMLKKMKELYIQSQNVQENNETVQSNTIEKANEPSLNLNSPNRKINFLEKAKNRVKTETALTLNQNHSVSQLNTRLQTMENSLISKIGDMLSEKMDGFDEIIVELIRAKTENENLRQQVNNLNKQVYILKKELATFNALPFGLYTKKDKETL